MPTPPQQAYVPRSGALYDGTNTRAASSITTAGWAITTAATAAAQRLLLDVLNTSGVTDAVTFGVNEFADTLADIATTGSVEDIEDLTPQMIAFLESPTSANLKAALDFGGSSSTGSGVNVFASSPTIASANLTGTPTINGLKVETGTGSPEGVVTAPVGSRYYQTDATGGALWLKEIGSGNTGWVKGREVFNVKAFGAKGDGATNDLAAINLAITAANAAGGGVVEFPPATYIVSPTTNTFIVAKSNVTLRGHSGATLKIANNAGNFDAVISQSASVTNFAAEGLKFDLNPSGNTTGTIAIEDGRIQTAIHFTDVDGVTVRNCRFDPCCGVQTVLIAGNGCKNVRVLDNDFRFVRRGSGTTYDNSAIYVEAVAHEIRGNRGVADVAEAARGFVETHNGPGVVSGNRSKGYQTGCNVVGGSYADAQTPNNIVVEGNSFADTNSGITIWPLAAGLRNVTIQGNAISLLQVQHNLTQCWGIAVITDAVASGATQNLVIKGNPITFEADTRTTAAASAALDPYYMGGILIGGRAAITGGSIEGNIVTNSPAIGIRVGETNYSSNTVTCFDVSGNSLVDCGRNANIDSFFWAALLADGSLTNVRIHDNPIADTGTPSPNGAHWFRAEFTLDTVNGLWVDRNRVTTATGSLTEQVDWTIARREYAEVAATLNFGSISAAASATLSVTVEGALVGDHVTVTPPVGLHSGLILSYRVSGADTVDVTLYNPTAGSIDPDSASFAVLVRAAG